MPAQMDQRCRSLGLAQSMGGTGVCRDNVMIESQCSVLRAEFYDRHTWAARAEAIRGIEQWIHGFSNTEPFNSAIGYQTSTEFEEYYQEQPAAVAAQNSQCPRKPGNPIGATLASIGEWGLGRAHSGRKCHRGAVRRCEGGPSPFPVKAEPSPQDARGDDDEGRDRCLIHCAAERVPPIMKNAVKFAPRPTRRPK